MNILFIHDDSQQGLVHVHNLTPDHIDINSMVGGWFDCVRSRDGAIVGYVNDTGLTDGMAPNLVASLLFARPLYGPCVVVGGLNEAGEYDGDNHDVPESVIRGVLPLNDIFRMRPESTTV